MIQCAWCFSCDSNADTRPFLFRWVFLCPTEYPLWEWCFLSKSDFAVMRLAPGWLVMRSAPGRLLEDANFRARWKHITTFVRKPEAIFLIGLMFLILLRFVLFCCCFLWAILWFVRLICRCVQSLRLAFGPSAFAHINWFKFDQRVWHQRARGTYYWRRCFLLCSLFLLWRYLRDSEIGLISMFLFWF